jgi:hypothetical protein
MLRNYLYIRKKYYQKESYFFNQRDKYLIKFFKNQLLYSSNKIQDIKMLLKATIDYKNKKYGKLNYE